VILAAFWIPGGGEPSRVTPYTDEEIELSHTVLQEAREILRLAAERSVVLRLTGSLAIRALCETHAALLDELGRRPYRDIDLLAYSKQKRAITDLFEQRGYVADRSITQLQEFGIKRLIYEDPSSHIKVDVFMDELVMAHTIPFLGRLELTEPTISVTDLLLTKLQIHEITENDLMDTIVLLAEHDVAPATVAINVSYITDIMRKDWGFYHSTMMNLEKVREATERYSALPDGVSSVVRARLSTLKDAIAGAPKTQRWKMRARVGTRVRWYEEVHEVDR
jgi:hypothetical protein